MGTAPLGPNKPANWDGVDVPTIWQRMQREDDTFTLLQVGAWNRTADLLDAHGARLEALLTALAEVWPPTDGSAARAYLEKVRELISSVAQTRDQAAANAYTVDSMMDQLMNTRAEIEALNQEYQSSRAPEPINRWAQTSMTEADKSIYDHGTRLITIDQYRAPFWQAQITSDSNLGSTNAVGGSTEGGRSIWGGTPGQYGGVADPSQQPSLVGAATPVVSPPTDAGSPAGGLPAGGGTGANPMFGTPVTAIDRPRVPDISGYTNQEPIPRGRASHRDSTTRRQEGEPSAIRDTKPGVAGEADTLVHGLLTPGPTAGARRGGRRSRDSSTPYSQWETLDGVPPVLTPEPEPLTYDPGPGVWGIDR